MANVAKILISILRINKVGSFAFLLSLHLIASFPALFLAGCSLSEENNTEVFRYNEYSNISSLDPAFARTQSNIWAVNQLFNGLVALDDSLKVVPDLAQSWQISEDALVYDFLLRADVFFHTNAVFGADSTRRVTARDFEFSFKRLNNPKLASPGAWVMNLIDSFTARNDSVFSIKLKKPFPAFMGLLSTKYCSVVPFEAVDFYAGTFGRNPVGTGPFMFKRWIENVKLVFRRNARYFEKDKKGETLPYLEAVAITFLPDKMAAFLQLLQGESDFISGLDAAYKDEVLTPNGSLQPKIAENYRLLSSPYLNTEYLAFFMDSNSQEIHSLELRRAVNMGFDRKKMITWLRNGQGTPATGGMIPKGLPGYNLNAGYRYDIEKARRLVKIYQNKTGDTAPEITLTTDSNYLDLCEFIQRELEKIGVKVRVEVMPAANLKQGKATGKLDCFRASWIADYPDAENYMSLFYSQNFAPEGPNYTHFGNKKFDSLYLETLVISDAQKRALLYRQMDSLVMHQSPVVPLYYDQSFRLISKQVQNLRSNPINLLNLKEVKKLPN